MGGCGPVDNGNGGWVWKKIRLLGIDWEWDVLGFDGLVCIQVCNRITMAGIGIGAREWG